MELAATRLIAMRKNKGKSIAACLNNHTSYIQNPDKTEQGELVSSYQCSPLTVDEEFMLTKRLYEQTTGRRQKSDVIAYQVRQSFRPGEVTPEEANKIGYEFAERFLKGKHAFIVATHTDRAHIHNHIIYNSTALDGTRKFRDFYFSALAVQRLSDLICLEHQLSVIQKKPYRERQKRILYPPKESNRDKLCTVIDNILLHDKLKDFAAFLDALEQQGYEVKRGKHPSVKGKGQRRFIRFRTLGAGYTEEEIKMVLDGKAEHQPPPKQPLPEKKFGLLVDIPTKMAESKTSGYKKWATRFNLKEMSKTLLYLQEKKIDSADELRERAAAATERYHTLGDSIKAAEKRMGEIAVLRAHIVNYAKTRDAYAAYRKAGYSKKFLEAHREEIELHKAAKAAFDEADLKKLPKVKDLNVEYFELLSQKKAAYPEYRKAKEFKTVSCPKIAKECTIREETIERIFRGETVSLDSAQQVATALGKTVEQMFEVEIDRRPMTKKTMREYNLFIRSVLNYANDNYGTSLQMPMIKASGRKGKSVDCLHSDEVEALQAALQECSMLEKAIVLCLLNTGVRRGELAGLTWKDVNFREGTIHVSKSLLVFPNYGYQLTTTKESNIRDVDVAPEFMDFLKDYYAQWKAQKKLMGASWQKNLEKKGSKYAQSLLDLRGNDFVICNDYGFPINPDSYGALVRRVGKKAGIEKIHPHMFRHTFVSILLSNPNIGVATVAAEAGHAQPSTTLAIYTQVYDRRRDEIRKQMSRELYK